MHRIREPSKYFRLFFHVQRLIQRYTSPFTTTIDGFDLFSNEPFQRHVYKDRFPFKQDYNFRHFMGMDINSKVDVDNMTVKEIEDTIQDCLSNNKDKQITKIIDVCLVKRKCVNNDLLKQLFIHYSVSGKVAAVQLLQNYCYHINPSLYKRNGEFLHYLAKAQCMKGNSDKGLAVLKEAYTHYTSLRSYYRSIFSELIYDIVQNRSEASIVILERYVLEFSEMWNDNYPLICFWHICWSSTWFSDQVISDKLLETSEVLRDIVKDKATTFSINILRDYNEDAVIRLLQTLLKYKMMVEYTNVLQILFSYKLKNRDLRGCTEIIKNCQTLGISLPSCQQGRYIKMLINTTSTYDKPDDKPKRPESTNFKLKF